VLTCLTAVIRPEGHEEMPDLNVAVTSPKRSPESKSDGVDAPPTASKCATLVMLRYQAKEKASMEKATIIGIDLAKRVFQVHGATQEGRPVFRKKVSRAQLLGFLAKQSPAVVAMEACATAHGWGRAISGLGHEVRLIPPIYVKPFVRRQKNDAADAEAIAEAASRPTMRFVSLKTEEQQARSMIFRTRDLLVRQRTQLCATRPFGGARYCRSPRAYQGEGPLGCAARDG
jgi:Transposase